MFTSVALPLAILPVLYSQAASLLRDNLESGDGSRAGSDLHSARCHTLPRHDAVAFRASRSRSARPRARTASGPRASGRRRASDQRACKIADLYSTLKDKRAVVCLRRGRVGPSQVIHVSPVLGAYSHTASDGSISGRCGSLCHHARMTFSERTCLTLLTPVSY